MPLEMAHTLPAWFATSQVFYSTSEKSDIESGGNGNSCPMCRDTFFAPWPQQPGIQNHVADISDDTAEQNAQEQQDLASSDAASEGQDSDGDHWVENRWMGYDEWDQENYSDPFW